MIDGLYSPKQGYTENVGRENSLVAWERDVIPRGGQETNHEPGDFQKPWGWTQAGSIHDKQCWVVMGLVYILVTVIDRGCRIMGVFIVTATQVHYSEPSIRPWLRLQWRLPVCQCSWHLHLCLGNLGLAGHYRRKVLNGTFISDLPSELPHVPPWGGMPTRRNVPIILVRPLILGGGPDPNPSPNADSDQPAKQQHGSETLVSIQSQLSHMLTPKSWTTWPTWPWH